MHSLVFIIIPASTPNIRAEVDRLMRGSECAPGKVYPTHEMQCCCVGHAARHASWEIFDASPEGVSLMEKISAARQNNDDNLENALLVRRLRAVGHLEQTHPDYRKPDVHCDLCKGTGILVTSRDPQEMWDSWEIGGRWSGWFREQGVPIHLDDTMYVVKLMRQFRDFFTRRRLLAKVYPLNENVARADDVLETPVPAAIVTPEGHWYEGAVGVGPKDQFLCDELPDYEKEERASWAQQFREFMRKYADHLVVVVDSHL